MELKIISSFAELLLLVQLHVTHRIPNTVKYSGLTGYDPLARLYARLFLVATQPENISSRDNSLSNVMPSAVCVS